MTLKEVLWMIWPACIVAMIITYFFGPQRISWLAGQKVEMTMRERVAYVIMIVFVGLFMTAGGIIVSTIKKGG